MKALFATRNRAAAELARTLLRLARTDLPLLLEGETGVGKSYVAARSEAQFSHGICPECERKVREQMEHENLLPRKTEETEESTT